MANALTAKRDRITLQFHNALSAQGPLVERVGFVRRDQTQTLRMTSQHLEHAWGDFNGSAPTATDVNSYALTHTATARAAKVAFTREEIEDLQTVRDLERAGDREQRGRQCHDQRIRDVEGRQHVAQRRRVGLQGAEAHQIDPMPERPELGHQVAHVQLQGGLGRGGLGAGPVAIRRAEAQRLGEIVGRGVVERRTPLRLGAALFSQDGSNVGSFAGGPVLQGESLGEPVRGAATRWWPWQPAPTSPSAGWSS